MYMCVYIYIYTHTWSLSEPVSTPSRLYYGGLPKSRRVFFVPRPWHIEIRHRVEKTSTTNLFGFEALELNIRKLKLWKPTVYGGHLTHMTNSQPLRIVMRCMPMITHVARWKFRTMQTVTDEYGVQRTTLRDVSGFRSPRGFPFQMELLGKHRTPTHNTILHFRRISFEKEIPSGGSRAGDISQTSCPRRPLLPASQAISLTQRVAF